MEGGLRFTLLTYSSEIILKKSYEEALRCPPKYSVHCRIINEADLKEHAHPDPQVYETKPYQEDGEIPMTAAYFFAYGDLFMVGGMRSGMDTIDSNGEIVDVFGDENPSKGLWCAQPPPPVGYWIRRPTTMNSKRDFPIALPLRNDGRIFICGGTSEPKCWVELYDPKKGTFEGVDLDLPAKHGSPYVSSCFQYTDKEVMVMVYYPKDEMHSLLLYNLERKLWSCFAENVPIPIFQSCRRKLVYVGGDILFIIDHACLMYVYDLSSQKKVGEVGVVGLGYWDDGGVLGAFYAGDTDVKCTSWIFYLFLPDGGHAFCDLQYAKVEVVQGKGGVYSATVRMEGVLKVGSFLSIYIIADREIAKNEVKTKECSNTLVGKALLPKKRAREPLLKEKGKEKIDD